MDLPNIFWARRSGGKEELPLPFLYMPDDEINYVQVGGKRRVGLGWVAPA